jgi:hypothetical protein
MLRDNLTWDSYIVKANAARSLGQLEEIFKIQLFDQQRYILNSLIELLEDVSISVCTSAMKALIQLSHVLITLRLETLLQTTLERLLKVLADKRYLIRANAAQLLGELCGVLKARTNKQQEVWIDRLALLLEDEYDIVRKNAIQTFAQWSDLLKIQINEQQNILIMRLMLLLEDRCITVKECAIQALGHIMTVLSKTKGVQAFLANQQNRNIAIASTVAVVIDEPSVSIVNSAITTTSISHPSTFFSAATQEQIQSDDIETLQTQKQTIFENDDDEFFSAEDEFFEEEEEDENQSYVYQP